jgi:hypothetical protein
LLDIADEVESGQCTVGARLESGRDIGKTGCGGEFGAGFGDARGAGQQQAERDVSGGKERVGDDGRAVEGLGCGSFGVERFQCQAEVVEDFGVVGGLGVEVGEDLECGGKIAGGERVVGLLDLGSVRSRFAGGMREVLRVERWVEEEENGEEEICRALCPLLAMRARGPSGWSGWLCGAVLRVEICGWRGAPPVLRAVPVMVCSLVERRKADSSASLRNDKKSGLHKFGNRI